MKSVLPTIKNQGTALLALLFISFSASATTFTAVSSGNWSSSSTWGTSAPSSTVTSDEVIVPSGITVTMDENITINGSAAILNVGGTLTGSSSTYLTIAEGTLSGGGNITSGYVAFGAGAVALFTGNITTDNFGSQVTSLGIAANIIVKQNMALAAGALSINSGGSLNLNSGANIIVTGGTLVGNGGNVILTNAYNVTYNSTDAITGIELTGSGLTNVTVAVPSGEKVTLTHDLTVNGTLTLTSGTLALGASNLIIKGNVAENGTGDISSTMLSSINISTGQSLSGNLMFSGSSNAVKDLTINVGSGNHAQINGTLDINGTLTLTSGSLVLSSAIITLSGDIASTGSGNISTSGNSDLIIHTATAPTGALTFDSKGNTVNNFTVNIINGGTLKLNSDMMVNGTFTFTSGRVDVQSYNLTVASSGTVTGGSSTTYVITSGGGALVMSLSAGSSTMVTYPVGTSTYYFPATLQLNTGSSGGSIGVNVNEHVYAQGTTGNWLSASQHAVDATWNMHSDISSNMDVNMTLEWNAMAEVNGFDRTKAYISHYTNGAWDMSAQAAASSQGASMYSITRTHITSMSPFAVFDNSTTGIESPAQTADFSFYPNPAISSLSISGNFENVGQTYAEISNACGQVMCTTKITSSSNNIPVDALTPGLYYVKVYDGNASTVKKFIKL